MIENNEKLHFNNLNELLEHFNSNYKEGNKLRCVKSFKDLTELGLREAKDWIDQNWFEGIGTRIYKYIQSKEHIKIIDNEIEKEFDLNKEFANLYTIAEALGLKEQFENLCLIHIEGAQSI